MTEEMEGEIQQVEQRKTNKGQKYHRVQVGSKWGSYWGNMKNVEVGNYVKAEYEDVEKPQGNFTNWKKISPLDQEEEKEQKKQRSTERRGKGQAFKAQKRFEIRKCKALDCAVNTIENPSVSEIKKLYPIYVNLLSKTPSEFAMNDHDDEEDSDAE